MASRNTNGKAGGHSLDISRSIYVHPADRSGCGTYRMINPARAVGIEPDFKEYQVLLEKSPLGNRVVDIVDPPAPGSVVIVQRPCRRHTAEMIPILQEKYGVAVVVEIDDHYHALPLQHPERQNVDPQKHRDYNWNWLMRACEAADLVIASTPLLAEVYGAHGRVVVLPNYVPAWYLNVQREPHDGVWIGWTGSTQSHIRDLMVLKDSMQPVLDETGAELHVVGTGEDVARQLKVRKDPISTGWVSIEDYPNHYAQFDVAICPLRNSPFNNAKSWLKGLEAAALGVVPIMSPSDEYVRLHEMGIGLIAETPQEWRNAMHLLCHNAIVRQEMANKGREVVARHFLIEDQAWKWLRAWETAASIRLERQRGDGGTGSTSR